MKYVLSLETIMTCVLESANMFYEILLTLRAPTMCHRSDTGTMVVPQLCDCLLAREENCFLVPM